MKRTRDAGSDSEMDEEPRANAGRNAQRGENVGASRSGARHEKKTGSRQGAKRKRGDAPVVMRSSAVPAIPVPGPGEGAGKGAGTGASASEATAKRNRGSLLPAPAHALSRGQRKRRAQREALMRRRAFAQRGIAKAQLARDVQAHGEALGDVSGLSAVIEAELAKQNSASAREEAQGKKTRDAQRKALRATSAKGRQRLAVQELAVFQQVLAHPAFIQDPAGAIAEHLEARFGARDDADNDL